MFPAILLVAGAVLYTLYRTRQVPSPRPRWRRFTAPGTVPLDPHTVQGLEGIYRLDGGGDFFGEKALLRWSYTLEGKRPQYHLSLFFEKEGALAICTGRREGNAILLAGYWRKLKQHTTGTIQLEISSADTHRLLSGTKQGLCLSGRFGNKAGPADESLVLRFEGPLPQKKKLHVIGHRGGARDMDFMDVSENSLDMFLYAARMGCTGVEIDVRLTKDKVPVIFHDSFLWFQTIKHTVYGGTVNGQTLEELRAKELKKGGVIPTLREALDAILYRTPLELVWLDIKEPAVLDVLCSLQEEYRQKAAALGRTLDIYLGISNKPILEAFLRLKGHEHIPCLTELEAEDAVRLKARVWAPQYTGGTQHEDVARMQAAGKKVFVWSLDHPAMIRLYLEDGGYDGVVTNSPSTVNYQYYAALN